VIRAIPAGILRQVLLVIVRAEGGNPTETGQLLPLVARFGSATSFSLFRGGSSIWFALHPQSFSIESSRVAAQPQRSLTGRRPGRSITLPPPVSPG
jgi:hypothetical protein